MKIPYYLILLPLLFSCQNKENTEDVGTSESSDGIQSVEIYRSTDRSFQADFILKIDQDQATMYGWDVPLENEKDTIYYRAQCKQDKDSNGILMSLHLDQYELTKRKVTPYNMDEFKPDTTLGHSNYSILFIHHSSFSYIKSSGDSIEFGAVKHSYSGRFDKFIFEKINDVEFEPTK